MDLYFQGLAWFNKGWTPANIARARSFFDRALAADPDNVDALVGSARVDELEGALSFASNPLAAFAAAEVKLTKALSSVPDHAHGHLVLGLVDIFTGRAAKGISECEHALEIDRNLAHAHYAIGVGSSFVGRAEETEAHIGRALRLSPRDPMAYTWMYFAGAAKLQLGVWEEAATWLRRSIEANRNYPHPHFGLAVALAHLGRLDEAQAAVKTGLTLNPAFAIDRARASWMAISQNPTFLTQLAPIVEGLRKAGLPEQ